LGTLPDLLAMYDFVESSAAYTYMIQNK